MSKKEEILSEFKNILFQSSEEEDSIEHVDRSYSSFIKMLDRALNDMYDEGKKDSLKKGRAKYMKNPTKNETV